MSLDTLRVLENRQKIKMKGNCVEVRKLNGEIQKKNQERQGKLSKEKMKGIGRAQ